MMRGKFRFTKDYDHRVSTNAEVAYKAGQELIIPKEHAESAKAAGAGDYVAAEKKSEKDKG